MKVLLFFANFSLCFFLNHLSSVTDCNASKYMSGTCGGTTRVAVLVGGNFTFLIDLAGMAAQSFLDFHSYFQMMFDFCIV